MASLRASFSAAKVWSTAWHTLRVQIVLGEFGYQYGGQQVDHRRFGIHPPRKQGRVDRKQAARFNLQTVVRQSAAAR